LGSILHPSVGRHSGRITLMKGSAGFSRPVNEDRPSSRLCDQREVATSADLRLAPANPGFDSLAIPQKKAELKPAAGFRRLRIGRTGAAPLDCEHGQPSMRHGFARRYFRASTLRLICTL
jgi:hypothetical protein